MLCDNCESELRKSWKFCPTCGAEIIREDIFISLGNILRSITKETESDFFPERRKTPGYKVDIVEEVETKKVDEEKHTGKRNQTMQKTKSKQTIEPKTSIKNLGNRIFFELKLPVFASDFLNSLSARGLNCSKIWSHEQQACGRRRNRTF